MVVLALLVHAAANNSQEIANGTGITSIDGDFVVDFEAKPDRSVERESQPVFVYTVYADVTDTAGETRSSEQTVNIGYTSLAARITAKDWLTTDTPVEFKLNTETLDGEGQSASGKLTVYRLKSPNQVQRQNCCRTTEAKPKITQTLNHGPLANRLKQRMSRQTTMVRQRKNSNCLRGPTKPFLKLQMLPGKTS